MAMGHMKGYRGGAHMKGSTERSTGRGAQRGEHRGARGGEHRETVSHPRLTPSCNKRPPGKVKVSLPLVHTTHLPGLPVVTRRGHHRPSRSLKTSCVTLALRPQPWV